MDGKIRENLILIVSVIAESLTNNNILEIGEILLNKRVDTLSCGGFWLWEVSTDIVFYSPHFRKSLGFTNEKDFPNEFNSWLNYIDEDDKKITLDNLGAALIDEDDYPFYQDVKYNKKDGSTLNVTCSGLVLRVNGKPKYMVGTHKIIK